MMFRRGSSVVVAGVDGSVAAVVDDVDGIDPLASVEP
jgi:hypothetical protein